MRNVVYTLNGSSPDTVIEDAFRVSVTLRGGLMEMASIRPHGRDFAHTADLDAALREHNQMVEKVKEVLVYTDAVMLNAADELDARVKRSILNALGV